METVTLEGQDFARLHNSLCDLSNICDSCSDDLARRLNPVLDSMRAALAGAYAQDSAAFDSKMDYYHQFQRDNGLRTIWSIYELPIHGFIKDHPFQGARQVAYKQHWGDGPVFKEIQGGTWADLYRAADGAIRDSGDDHHIFIEHFAVNPEQPDQLLLTTGS